MYVLGILRKQSAVDSSIEGQVAIKTLYRFRPLEKNSLICLYVNW